jgi:DnaJ-class molecular chaperone
MKENKYHELDKQVSQRIRTGLIADGITSYPVKCEYCEGSGEHEPDNNGPIEACPVCNGDGHYLVAV